MRVSNGGFSKMRCNIHCMYVLTELCHSFNTLSVNTTVGHVVILRMCIHDLQFISHTFHNQLILSRYACQ